MILTYSPFLISFLIIFNSFCIGKIVQKNCVSLSNNISFFAGYVIYNLIYGVTYLPFILNSNLIEYYVYVVLSVQILLVIVYCFFYKLFFICFAINYKLWISSILSILVLLLCYYLFYLNNHPFSWMDQTSNVIWIPTRLNYFSISNLQLFNFFTKSSALKSDFLIYQNLFYPIIFVFIGSFVLTEFYEIKNFKDIKGYIVLIFSSLLLGFFAFNQSDNNLFSNSFVILCFFYSISFFVRKNGEIEDRQYGSIFNFIIANLIFLNLQFIVLSVVFYIISILYVFIRKKDFGLNLVVESSIFFIFSLSIFFISKYTVNFDVVFVIAFSLLLSASVILFSILYISKKNYVKSYWILMQKATFSFSKYFKFIYLICFLAFSVLVLVSTFKDLTNDSDFSITFSRIDLYSFLTNVLNFNDNLETINFSNESFFVFYLILFFGSVFYLIFKWKKINELKNNLLFFSSIFLLIFNPFVIFEIRYLTNFLTINNKYDFFTYYNFIILLVFIFIANSFKNINFHGSKNLLNNVKEIKNFKNFLISSNQFFQNIIDNNYFQLSIYSILMLFFTFSIFICNL